MLEPSTQKLWDQWNESNGPNYPHDQLVRFCFRSFSPEERKHARALDLGCGSGVHTAFLARENFSVTALDLSPQGVANTRARLATLKLHADVRVQDIAYLDCPHDFFDLVVCVSVFDSTGPHIARDSLKSVVQYMKKKSRAFFLFASHEDFRVIGSNPYHLYGYSYDEVKHLFESVDFAQVHIDSVSATYEGERFLHKDWIVTATR